MAGRESSVILRENVKLLLAIGFSNRMTAALFANKTPQNT
jgi:hypothetical protein